MAVVATLLLGLFFSGPSTEDVNRAVQQVFGDRDLESEFPGREAPAVPQQEPRRPVRLPWLEPILWVVVGIGVLIAIVALGRRLGGFEAAVEPTPIPEGAAPEGGVPLRLADAEAAASEGRCEDAIHILLLVALDGIARRDPVPRSLTSREVLGRPSVHEDARPALGLLVRTVEASLFGSQPAGPEEWHACREGYARLVSVLERGRP